MQVRCSFAWGKAQGLLWSALPLICFGHGLITWNCSKKTLDDLMLEHRQHHIVRSAATVNGGNKQRQACTIELQLLQTTRKRVSALLSAPSMDVTYFSIAIC